MRTEIARSIRDIPGTSASAQTLVAVETAMRPLEDHIVIDRNYQESRVAELFDSLWQLILNIPKEWKIFAGFILGIALALVLATKLRSPIEKQGTIFTEQLKTYKEMHNGTHHADPPADEVETEAH